MTCPEKVVAALLAYDSALYAQRIARKMPDADLEEIDPVPGRADALKTLRELTAVVNYAVVSVREELRRCLNEIPEAERS